MVLKQRRSIVSGRWVCLCVSQLGPPPDHPGRRYTREDARRRSYISLAHQDHNISTTYTDPSILDHQGLSSNQTIHPSVHLAKLDVEARIHLSTIVLQLLCNNHAGASCVFKQQGTDQQSLQKVMGFYFLYFSCAFMVSFHTHYKLQAASSDKI